MKIKPKNKISLIEAALGKRPFDLVIKNVKMLNSFTGEIYPAEIGIFDGFIAYINSDPDSIKSEQEILHGEKEYDGKGMYLIPGLIDTHIHIESTMMTPRNFAKAVIPWGTTTVITDPHEVANVAGIEGIKYMLESSEDVPMHQFILSPSCVPSVPGFENAGATFNAEEISEIMDMDRVLGLAEVMDFLGVMYASPRMMSILDKVEEKGGFIQGHAPQLRGRGLSAYLCGGPKSDHENYSGEEAREKLRLGMNIDARESSLVKNIGEVISAVKDFKFHSNLSFCTDDREPEDILSEGHMNFVLMEGIKAGLDPIDAIICATLNAAREIGIENLGAIAPGYVANLVIVPSLTELKAEAVFFEGKLVAENQKMIINIPEKKLPQEHINTMYVNKIETSDFRIKAPIMQGTIPVNVITYISYESPITSFVVEELPVKNGYIDITGIDDLKYVAVINRHKGHDKMSLGIVRGFGTNVGTVASTVSHDCHNLTIVYSNPEEAYAAAQGLIDCGGGISCALNGKLLDILPLPVFGLMSTLECSELKETITHMKESLRNLGLSGKNPLLRIATLCLPVIPEARITDMGLVSVLEQKFKPLFAEK